MRMERINDRQVRCVITAQDLEERKISLNELKYGSRETKELFHDMLSAASSKYRFNEEGLPIMIEAIPVSADELLVIISAVEDAEELDPHFAKFADVESISPENSEEEKTAGFAAQERLMETVRSCLLDMADIDAVIRFCRKIGPVYPGHSALYRKEHAEGYYLALMRPEDMSGKDFNAVLNSVMEYADLVPGGTVLAAYLKEHDKPVMEEPLRVLSRI